jgi:putative hydrolase of the HAD superfamily
MYRSYFSSCRFPLASRLLTLILLQLDVAYSDTSIPTVRGYIVEAPMFHSIELSTIAFDADDTLWHNEDGFHQVEKHFAALLADRVDPGIDVMGELEQAERNNVKFFGYGVKSFTFSMIETATRLTEGRVSSAELASIIQSVIEQGRWLLSRPVQLLDDVSDVLTELAPDYRLLLVTKGDSHHQMAKVEESGLAKHFDHVEVVREKDPSTYLELANRHGVDVTTMLMVGNSVKSDILPVLEIGGHAIHIPYQFTWALERADIDDDHPGRARFARVNSVRDLRLLLS